MSCFLYFIPAGEQPLTNELLEQAGLRDIFDSSEQCATTYLKGRASHLGSGFLIADKDALGPDRTLTIGASWKPRGNRAFVRLFDDSSVAPESLARPALLPGLLAVLGDGNPWQVPVARVMDSAEKSTNILPAKMVLDDKTDKWVEGDVLAKYRRLETIASEWWDQWYPVASEAIEKGETSYSVDVEKPYDLAVEVLAHNYRIGRAEASLLGLFVNYDNASDIMAVLVDASAACRFLVDSVAKKKSETHDDSPISVGATA